MTVTKSDPNESQEMRAMNTEFVVIEKVRIEVQDRAGLQVLVDLTMHQETRDSRVQQMPMFAELAFGYEGEPVGRTLAALFETCGVTRLADLPGKPLVVEYDKPTRSGLAGQQIPTAVSFASVDGLHEHNIQTLVSGKEA